MPEGAIAQIGFLVIFIMIMYLLLIRPQKKKEKQINEMRASVQVGDEIITIGGICGKVVRTKDESLTIQVGADKVKFEIMRWGVSRIAESYGRTSPARRPKPAEDEDDADDAKKPLPKRMRKARDEADEFDENNADNANNSDEDDTK